MKIYTKTGDKGETSLFGGKRVSKDILRIETYGTVDELNSILGIARCMNTNHFVDDVLLNVQKQLFTLGSDLASPYSNKSKKNIFRIGEAEIINLEKLIDKMEADMNPIKNFIIPGGVLLASYVHFARAICRRIERMAVRLSKKEKVNKFVLIYLNRLSDFLFVLARWVNTLEKKGDTVWVSRT